MVNHMGAATRTLVTNARRLVRRVSGRSLRAGDVVLAVVVFLVIVFVFPEEPNGELTVRAIGEASIGELAVAALGSAVLCWRRTQPLVVLAAAQGATVLALLLGWSELVGIVMLVALYSVGRYVTHDWWSYIGLGAVLAFVAISSVADPSTAAAEMGFGLLVTLVVWYIGTRLRMRDEHTARRERERAADARRAVAEERTRIARELHDVVAHRVSLMTVQAGAAKTVAADDPKSAARAMQDVEQAGRQALDELRHLLGVLRPDAESDALGPQPRLTDVPRLVDQFRAAGLDVSLTIDDTQIELPARVDLSAYRIVQEALTNVLKHAGPGARTDVRVSTDSRSVAIEVLDDGHGVSVLTGSGHGIIGMRERAMLLGGHLEAGPRPGRGFRVVAQLPVGKEPA